MLCCKLWFFAGIKIFLYEKDFSFAAGLDDIQLNDNQANRIAMYAIFTVYFFNKQVDDDDDDVTHT